jgi:hypothetical protein
MRRVLVDGRAVVATWKGLDRHPLYGALADAAAVVPRFAQDPSAFRAYVADVTDDTRDVVERYRRGDHVVVPMHANIAVAS